MIVWAMPVLTKEQDVTRLESCLVPLLTVESAETRTSSLETPTGGTYADAPGRPAGLGNLIVPEETENSSE